MKPVLFSTSDGAPIAFLLVSDSQSSTRDCIFVTAARDEQTHGSLEAQVILPDRPIEYRCSLDESSAVTTVRFENQNGWIFAVKVGVAGRGEWSATKEGQRLSGSAMIIP